MIRLNLRLRRNFIIWWLLGIWAFLAITPPAYVATYPDLACRGPVVASIQNNVGTQAMYGRLPSPGTIGQFTAWETGAWLCILSSVMMVLLFSSLHRKPEHSGVAEILHAQGLPAASRHRAAIATSAVVAAINGLGAILILLVLRVSSAPELTVSGSFSFGLTLILTMLAFLALTSILHILWGSAGNFNRLGLLSIGIAFIVRMVADTSEAQWVEAFNWISPLGWRSVILPFSDDNWWAVGIFAITCLVLFGLAFFLDSKRAFDSSVLHRRHARSHRERHIASVAGLSLYQYRGNLITWSLVIGIILLTLIPLIDSLIPSLQGDEATQRALEAFLPTGEMQTIFIVYIFQIASILLCVAAITPVINSISQERSGLTDSIRSAGTRRSAPYWGAVATSLSTLLACTIFAIAGSLGGLIFQTTPMENAISVVILSSLSIAVHALFFIGITAATAGFFPRAIYLSWIPFMAAAVVSLLGTLFSLTEKQMSFSPLSHSWGSSSEPLWPLFSFAAAGILLIVCGSIGAKRRNLL